MHHLQANPLLYLNMGGEMLYVLRQRLKAQRIAVDKSIQVLDEVTEELVNPLVISKMFQQQSTPVDMAAIRSSLERAVLSSIMRLDESSMGKLFDLIIMMVKYQINAATGPRELLLITLNHIDMMRDMLLMDSRGHESLVLVHRMLIQLYGNLTYDEMWQIRKICLAQLGNYNVRVSILLRIGQQNEDASLNLPVIRNYDERYVERMDDLSSLKILENSCKACNVGSLELIGERVTFLGGNVYSTSYGINDKVRDKSENRTDRNKNNRATRFKGEPGSKAELGMLAIQLGSNEDQDISSSASRDYPRKNSRPFTLELFTGSEFDDRRRLSSENHRRNDDRVLERDEPTSSIVAHEHREKLNNICANFIADEEESRVSRKMELLELMDQIE